MSEIFEGMLEAFLFETSQNLKQLEQIVLSAEERGSFSENDINEIFRIMHTVKGSSAMMEYGEISSLTHKVEDLFYFLRENKPGYDCSDMCDLIFSVIDFLGAELEEIRAGRTISSSPENLLQRISGMLSYLSEQKGESSGKKSKAGKKNALSAVAGKTSKKGVHRFLAVHFFEDGCTMEGARAFELLMRLNEFAQVVECLPDVLSEETTNSQNICEKGFSILFDTEKTEEELHRFFENAMFHKEHTLTVMDGEDRIPAPSHSEIKEPSAELTGPSGDAKTVNRTTGEVSGQNFISVNVTKLDKLMDMVGELVLAESMVIHNPDLNGFSHEQFDKAARQLNLITNELQDLAMSVRMVPLVGTFQKMNRIVRDMGKKLNKEVALEIIGGETEVDKNIIDHISDPLMHLVRNSVDHGLESTQNRISLGKPRRGTITLEAKNEGGEVFVIVKDDGKGLDREKILQRARNNGLLTKPEGEMTDKEINSLIFLPGFSTNEEITEYSGRGVGMDVVVKNIEAVGGRVSVESAEGQGTVITIRFPLTLAIIEGMNLRVGESVYVLPITGIRQLLRANSKDIISHQGNEMILFRGGCYPVIRLHRYYGISSDTEDFDEGILVMAENGSQMVCLFADELVGESQVVVKPLPKYIKRVKGVSGCTMLGDGSISLILDVRELIESVDKYSS